MSDSSARVAERVVGARYTLFESVGRGGMGTVWRSRDELLGRPVAVKEIIPPMGLTPEEQEQLSARTLREARAAARISSRAAVTVYDVVEQDGRPWIVMELLEARSLAEELRDEGPLEPAQVARIGLELLDALEAAHRAGVVHRDVKPANVLLCYDGRVVLTDFGIAALDGDPSLTATGTVLGSPAYMAPERAHGHELSPAMDLWSLGATLYAALDGKSPFQRTTALSTLNAVLTEPVPAVPEHAGPLGPVLRGLLAKDPAERIDTAEARVLLRAALGAAARAASGPASRAASGPSSVAVKAGDAAAPAVSGGAPAVVDLAAGDRVVAVTAAPIAAVAGPAAAVSAPAVSLAAPTASTRTSDSAPAPAASTLAPDASVPVRAASARAASTGTTADASERASGLLVATRPDISPSGAPVAVTVRADARATPSSSPRPPSAPAPAPAPAPRTAQPPRPPRRQLWPVILAGLLLVGLLSGGAAWSQSRPAGPAVEQPASQVSGPSEALPSPSDAMSLSPAQAVAAAQPGVAPQEQVTTATVPRPTSASSTPTATPSPASPAPSAPGGATSNTGVPAGFRLHRDPTGFAVAVPQGWSVSRVQGRVYFREPGTGRFLQVDQTDDPRPDVLVDWQRNESSVRRRFPEYQRISLQRVGYRDYQAADWDFRYRRGSGPVRVRNRNIRVNDQQAYALYFSVPESRWDRSEPLFQTFARTFRPA